VPLVDVTHDDTIDERRLRRLAELLPEIVAEAVDCPEEPWIGPPRAGDLEIRTRVISTAVASHYGEAPRSPEGGVEHDRSSPVG